MVRVQMSQTGSLPGMVAEIGNRMAQDVTIGLDGALDGAILELRQELGRAFPQSRRLPTILTGEVEPSRPGRYSLRASARIYGRGGKRSSWPAPLWALAFGAEITPRNRKYLVIPTKSVPRDGGRLRLSPEAVEERFNEKLVFVPAGRFGKAACLVLMRQTIGRSGRVRQLTARRAAQGLKAKPTVMFWLIPRVTLPPKWDPRGIIEKWAGLVPDFIEKARRARESVERDAGAERARIRADAEFFRNQPPSNGVWR